MNLPAQAVSLLTISSRWHHPITCTSAASSQPTLITRTASHSAPKSSLYFYVHGFAGSAEKSGRAKTSEVERCNGSVPESVCCKERPKIGTRVGSTRELPKRTGLSACVENKETLTRAQAMTAEERRKSTIKLSKAAAKARTAKAKASRAQRCAAKRSSSVRVLLA